MAVESDLSSEPAEDGRAISMPHELVRFIQRETYSLLIKGYAGTGKTTLALTVLRALGSRDSFFYISTQVSPKQLFQYYPWLNRFIEQSPKSLGAEGDGSHHVMVPTFEDARLDEPESLFEKITNQLMDIKSPVIIIDSWDAIASFMDREARLNNERVLQTWRERAGAKLIFISEHPDDTTLDFLVDGILELKQSLYDNVRVREIFLRKLRGVRIDKPSYIFTLENGVFRSFAPYSLLEWHAKLRAASPRSKAELFGSRHVSSGYKMLDDALRGGFPKKGIVLLELDPHVSTSVAMAFLGGLAINFISNGHPVLFQPFDWIDPRAIMDYVEPLPRGKKNLFKILWTRKVTGMRNNVIVQSQTHSPSLAAVANLKKKYPTKVLLNIMGTDVIQQSNAGKGFMSMMTELMLGARAGDLSIAVLSGSQKEMLEYFSEVSDIHVRLLLINDTLFLQPLVPASTLYAIEFSTDHINLEPVV
ncbi:MAG: RAD55 family ATPase [Nitrososphaera sp.]